MATVVLNAYSKAYPFIVNRIRAAVYLQTDPQALIATIIDSTAGHPARTWSFPGLPRANYGFTLDEIDGSGNLTGNNLANFDVVPGEIEGLLTRDDEQVFPDVTPGYNSGDNSITFDGTAGKPDYIGWSIVPSELTGRGILQKGIDYSWDSTTGIFQLLQSGDVFQAPMNIHFNPQTGGVGNSELTVFDFQIEILDVTGSIDASMFGKKVIIEVAGNYGEFQLPDINLVPQGRRLMVEIGTSVCCKFLPFGSNIINFGRGNLYALKGEKFSLYKIVRGDGTKEWRVDEEQGNFLSCGRLVSEDSVIANLFNMQAADGSIVSSLSIHARIYNELVLNLPNTQVCNFDDWNTGNNKYLYSLANSSNPANLNKFHYPDRRDLFERNNNTGKAGDYSLDTVGTHTHKYNRTTTDIPSGTGQVQYEGNRMKNGGDRGLWIGDSTKQDTTSGIGMSVETAPKHYLINKYVLL